jgi:diacylglycerol kinase (ATP)
VRRSARSTIIVEYVQVVARQGIPVYRQAILIYNPVAGKLKAGGEKLIERVLQALTRAGHRVSAKRTPGPGEAAAIARDSIVAGADLILAFGGDGTINEVAEGVIGSRTPLGILPGGTANVVSYELKLGSSPVKVASRLADYRPERISVGRLKSEGAKTRHFLAMAGVGLDAHIVYRMSAGLERRWGKLAYWIGGFSQLARELEEFDVEIEGRTYRCSFALITKVRNYGGNFEIARRVSIVDDQFEVVLFAGSRGTRYLKYLAGVALNRLYGMSGVTILRAREVTFRAMRDDRVYIQIDGEYAGRLPGKVEVVPDALTLLIPASYRESSCRNTASRSCLSLSFCATASMMHSCRTKLPADVPASGHTHEDLSPNSLFAAISASVTHRHTAQRLGDFAQSIETISSNSTCMYALMSPRRELIRCTPELLTGMFGRFVRLQLTVPLEGFSRTRLIEMENRIELGRDMRYQMADALEFGQVNDRNDALEQRLS